MRNFVIASVVLHAVILLLLALGIHDPFQKTLKNEHPLFIDFVQIAEQSAAPKLSPQQKIEKAKPKPTSEPKPEPIPEVVEDSEPTEPEKTEPQEEKKPEPKPESKKEEKPEAAPLLKKKPDQKKPEKKETKKPEPKKPDKIKANQKKSKTKTAKKAEVNLKKNQSASKTDNKPDPKTKKAPKAALDDLLKDVDKDNDETEGEEGAPAQKVGDVVTASEIDALRQHIRKCWVVPAGIKGAKDMTVDIKMEISKDGTVLKADVIDKKRMANDNAYRTAAESAQRAVLDPQCNPLPLPKGKYDQWKDLEFSFNPKDMY